MKYTLTLFFISALVFCLNSFSIYATTQHTLDTLRCFDNKHGFVYYQQKDLQKQAARINFPIPGCVLSVSLYMGGNDSGTALLHFYGNEGGGAAPLTERDLIHPIKVRKSKNGVEKITVSLPRKVCVDEGQFFVVVDSLSNGAILLSDNMVKMPSCSSAESGEYFYQYVKYTGKNWEHGKYNYAVEIEAELHQRSDFVFSRDSITVDSTSPSSGFYSGISCADVNNDGYLDVLANNKLYVNREGQFFEETERLYNAGFYKGHIFIDINNDGNIDILMVGKVGKDNHQNILLLNQGKGIFTKQAIDLPILHTISSISVADLNKDNFPDLFIGQCSASETDTLYNYLFINTGNNTFQNSKAFAQQRSTSKGSSFIDLNNDGNLDLFTANYYTQPNQVRFGIGNGTFEKAVDLENVASSAANYTIGCHWGDSNNDGLPDLLAPKYLHPLKAKESNYLGSTVYQNSGHSSYNTKNLTLPYEEKHSGGAWGDVDNDGLLDCIVMTSCECRFADLYMQKAGIGFVNETYAYGLTGIETSNDALWADIDNNGTLDLLCLHKGALSVYKQKPGNNNYIEFDMQADGSKSAIGTRITIYTPNSTYTRDITSGRGLLMQDPLRIHIGIGEQTSIDSASVRWPDGTKESFYDISPNKITILTQGKGKEKERIVTGVDIKVYPNPFQDHTIFSFSLAESAHIRLEIYTVTGAKIRTLVDRDYTTGNSSVQWDGKTETGEDLPTGTYMYRYVVGNQESLGRISLIK